ncbi:RloB family protein [Mucilaginibacter flavidus]|uniref:RloB family protein n=1 Tax=Mucilaginibacter flavidus TaxID=2949309 RepID=UPI002093CCAE|nr:RloB family protein [Mucilaginibacter flavidus]MCO5949523.1 RloB family protein [Mucilaginibacter flavidus]
MRKKRGYDREVPEELVRDYKLFAIACEGGKREPQYFGVFRYLSPRLAVDVIEDVVTDEEMAVLYTHKSAPRWVLDRAMRYIEKEGLAPEDELWFVLDKDRWSDEQLRGIQEYCEQQPNWHVAISNPCFEVWLYFHMKADIAASASVSCNDFKHEISTFDKGGYHALKYVPLLKEAIKNAENADTHPGHFMPGFKETKMYELAKSVMSFVGENDFDDFLNLKLPKLIAVEDARIRASERAKAYLAKRNK